MNKESFRETTKNPKVFPAFAPSVVFFFFFLISVPPPERLGTAWFQLDTMHQYIESFKLPSVRDVTDKTDAKSLSLSPQRLLLQGISNADLNMVKNHSHFPTEKQLINSRESPSSAAEVQEKEGIFIKLRIPQLLESYIIPETESETAPDRKISVKRDLLQITGTLYRSNRSHSSSPPTFQRLVSTRFLSLPSNQFLSLHEWTSSKKTLLVIQFSHR